MKSLKNTKMKANEAHQLGHDPGVQGLQPGSLQYKERQEGFLEKKAFKGGFEEWLRGVLGLGIAWAKAQR